MFHHPGNNKVYKEKHAYEEDSFSLNFYPYISELAIWKEKKISEIALSNILWYSCFLELKEIIWLLYFKNITHHACIIYTNTII